MRLRVKKVTAIIPVLFIGVVLISLIGAGALPGAEKVYQGTVYVAGMGGHIAKAEVRIDPSQAEPISVVKLTRIKLHSDAAVAKKAYPTHDVRIDHAKNVMFWSAFVLDGKSMHAGKIDLATGKVVADAKFLKGQRTTAQGPMYCGSGQTKDKFLPVMMGYEGFVDVVDKETMKLERRVFFDHPKIPKNYVWAHGVNSPDGKEFALWMSLADAPGKFPREKEGRHLVFVLDTPSLVNGEIKVLRETTLTGDPTASALFRGFYTSDGTRVLISGRDRTWLLDAASLKVLAETANSPGWENHDIQPLPGDRYALLTHRVPMEFEPGKKGMDGQLELYDLTRMARVGKAVSVCQSCHRDEDIKTTSVACGLDSVWKQ
ncbi:MAG: hypothetical protein HY725_19955 [Candidatus Rokubacteria bacterium]|nr:hypothetical protein [Candidatus Rokubacteria bacterium]